MTRIHKLFGAAAAAPILVVMLGGCAKPARQVLPGDSQADAVSDDIAKSTVETLRIKADLGLLNAHDVERGFKTLRPDRYYYGQTTQHGHALDVILVAWPENKDMPDALAHALFRNVPDGLSRLALVQFAAEKGMASFLLGLPRNEEGHVDISLSDHKIDDLVFDFLDKAPDVETARALLAILPVGDSTRARLLNEFPDTGMPILESLLEHPEVSSRHVSSALITYAEQYDPQHEHYYDQEADKETYEAALLMLRKGGLSESDLDILLCEAALNAKIPIMRAVLDYKNPHPAILALTNEIVEMDPKRGWEEIFSLQKQMRSIGLLQIPTLPVLQKLPSKPSPDADFLDAVLYGGNKRQSLEDLRELLRQRRPDPRVAGVLAYLLATDPVDTWEDGPADVASQEFRTLAVADGTSTHLPPSPER